MGARRIRREQRQVDMATSRRENGMRKTKERNRRDQRMVEILKTAKYPYTSAIRSWLSAKLDRPAAQIKAEDVQKLVAGA